MRDSLPTLSTIRAPGRSARPWTPYDDRCSYRPTLSRPIESRRPYTNRLAFFWRTGSQTFYASANKSIDLFSRLSVNTFSVRRNISVFSGETMSMKFGTNIRHTSGFPGQNVLNVTFYATLVSFIC